MPNPAFRQIVRTQWFFALVAFGMRWVFVGVACGLLIEENNEVSMKAV
jgi:hypothetical protein